MKTFFAIAALLSFLLGLYSMWTSVSGSAHNHYQTRYLLLTDNRWQGVSPAWWELTQADVSAQPEKFGRAYREAVLDAHKLGCLNGKLQRLCLITAAAMFVTSCVGWWAARRTKTPRKELSNNGADSIR